MTTEQPSVISFADPAAEARLKRVVKRIHDLPSFPLVIRKLMEVAEDPDSSSRDLAQVMENDQGLSAKILKLVNSAFYSFSRPVGSLQHAVTLLGYNSIRSLAMSVSVKSMFKGAPFDLEAFWANSLATAIAAKLLAEKNRVANKDDVFTAGLLHDIGILLEARYLPEEMTLVLEAVESGESLLQAERQHIGVTHCVLGCWLSERWRLPGTLRDPILRHHDLTSDVSHGIEFAGESAELEPEHEIMVNIVSAADMVAHALGFTPLPGLTPKCGDVAVPGEIPAPLEPLFASCPIEEFLPEVMDKFKDSREFLKI